MINRKPFGKLTIAMGIFVLALFAASCSDSNNDNFPHLETEPPYSYSVTVTTIEIEDKDTGLPIEVGGEMITGLVYIEPGP